MSQRRWPAPPIVFAEADVCREDLLVDIDDSALVRA